MDSRIDQAFQEASKRHVRSEYRLRENYGRLEDYFGKNSVGEEIKKRFVLSPKTDFILENLQTHDKNLLVKKVQELLPNRKPKLVEFSKEGKATFRVELKKASTKYSDPQIVWMYSSELEKLAEFYGYGISKISDDFIDFEPRFTEDATKFIYEKCHGIVYHITDRMYLGSIQKSGLRIRNGLPGLPPYRKFPKRVYVSAFDPEKVSDIKSKLVEVSEIVTDAYDPVALRIRLPESGHSRIPFYRDTAMDEDAFFTYTSIPASYIEYIIGL